MKFTGIIQYVDSKGRIGIPRELANILEIQAVPVDFTVENGLLVLQRHREACIITGKVSRRNISLANGKIKVHPKEVNQLIEELKEYLEKID
ncbi:AbrB family transcriptional regulator [Bacillus thuringiensis]|uniref:AbrB family transcriptional regulator n=3 Tax=Bacillus thuringiensis TaxID=1428 RepID=A0AB35PB49_BACTU|nr:MULTISPECIES: hypothetical protein [Bacillus]EAO57224.1 Transcription state regulatory protein abrB [Bacillus thuringiensis serovar israelensis ATCC 35646]MEC3435222.1 AbrB family transcriptional regulator [Bacillus cereus]AFQ30337.1 AbrB family transcriptional regulator [Bacillus thuringiensis HD-789]AJH02430.1 putative transcriptional regulator [Bacillus thuringiensis HD1002]AND28527.1 AbrB family transcriptional regulator [Bacillus thuringiensis serovar israelensis]